MCALTLHGESFSRHRDVVLPLCGEAVMRQVVVLREFHQRVICGGQRLEKELLRKTDLRSKQQDTSALAGWIKDVKRPLAKARKA